MKKGIYLSILIVLLATFALGACAAPQTAASPAKGKAVWKVSVAGAPVTEFTSADYAKLKTVKLSLDPLDTHCSDGKSHVWEGALLKDVMDALGVKDYKYITLTATDDFTKDYAKEIVDDPGTILGTVMDGRELTAEEGFMEVIAAGEKASIWVKKLSDIKVNP
jgi:DMSO/TMAO reductase YedYZ molybdopterin-dependent catalytic subunit